jgi:DNA-binding Xre family transcriptional regulator
MVLISGVKYHLLERRSKIREKWSWISILLLGVLAMSSPEAVMHVLRLHMRASRMTYADLAQRIGMSESSVKRVFGQKDMALSRVAIICKALGVAMEDVLREAADQAPRTEQLSHAQEKALVSDPRLLLMAICCLGHWSLTQIVETYALSQAEGIRCLVRLDRLGLLVLRPDNGYRLRVSPTFHWRVNGPAQQFLREHVVPDYFAGNFGGDADVALCVPARLSKVSALSITKPLRHLAAEVARLQQQDRALPPSERDGYTLLVGFRSWEFGAFTAMRRASSAPVVSASVKLADLPVSTRHQIGPRKR